MAIRRKLTRLRLDKIAAVDSPCQEHATVAIIKRAPAEPDTSPKGLAKLTFQEALDGNMIASAVNEAFFDSFDGLWERNDAFREALADEFAQGGDGTAASAAYVASVKQLVDDAVSEARKAGATASDTAAVDKAFTAAADRWLESKKECPMLKITTKAELKAAVAKFNPETSPFGEVLVIRKAAADLSAEDELPADGPLAPAQPDPEVAKMKAELAVLKLSPEARAYHDGLDEAGRAAFIGKSADDQAKDIEAANASDPIVHKCKDGTEIRKSDGAAVLALAKANDSKDDQIAKLRGDLDGTTIEKRAGEKYPHIAKGVAVQMLKTASELGEDTEAGKGVLASLETMEKAQKGAFRQFGSTEGDGGQGDINKARTDYEAEVAKIAARDKIGSAAAMTKARREHPVLFKEAFPDTVEAAEESAEEARRQSAE